MANGSEAQADAAAQVAQFPIEIMARFTGQDVHQGYPGRMHGGVITGILDETIGRAVMFNGGEVASMLLVFMLLVALADRLSRWLREALA